MPRLGRKPGPRDARRAATTEQILSATDELLAEGEGFAALSVEQITERAGISRTAFYDYFDDKRGLLIKLIARADLPLFDEPHDSADRPSEPEAVEAQIAASLKWVRTNTELFRAAVEATSYDEVVRAFWRERLVDRFIDATERRIKRQQASGAALPINPRAAAEVIVVMVIETLYYHLSHDTGISDKRLSETLTTVVIRAVYGPVDKLAAKSR
jgi:TetR/AcrR family transcriptional regulator, ethionamide resistance regulator